MIIDLLTTFKSIMSSNLNSSDKRAKIQDGEFIVGLVQAVATAKQNFTLAELRLSVCQYLGKSIETSAFNERLGTKSLTSHLKCFLNGLAASTFSNSLNESGEEVASLSKKLGVKEIIGVDASMVTLWDGLGSIFKGTFMESAVKLHMATNLETGAVRWYDVTPGATHDSKRFPEINSESLYIFDLGYWSYNLLEKLSAKSSLYLSRVKKAAKLRVTRVIYGIGESAKGKDLLEINIRRKRGKIIEVYAMAKVGKEEKEYRVLGFWNKKTRMYHWYITNYKGSRNIIANLYRLRWQLELSFKALKSTLNFDRMPTLNENAVGSFALIALINYLFSMVIKKEADATLKTKASLQKSVKVYRATVKDIFEGLKFAKRMTKLWIENLKNMLRLFYGYMEDPNCKQRKSTLEGLLTY